jgi:ATP-dependent helicase Lhr and Lhr-like helicase
VSDGPIAAESTAAPTPFTRLHPSVRYLIAEVLRFSGLRPVQAMTIDPILDGRDLIVLAPTAGGKTEAAFFPVFSRILTERLPGVSVLYVSPLRALLNNQEGRLRRMAEGMGLSVGKWHGDVTAGEKRAIVAEPPAVLLITPESLEVLLMIAPARADALLNQVRIVIIDEVHALARDARGAHLLSVVERLQMRCGQHIQRIGLSATVGNPEALALWLQGSGAAARPVVISPPREPTSPLFRFRAARTDARAAELIRTIGAGKKRLVFVQGRRSAESLAGALEALGVRAWVHHSSVGREQRDAAEQAFEWTEDPVLVATSSMELGIDVGDLDEVYQLDAPGTVSSLAQRLGRSGRRPGTRPEMTFLLDGPETLLVALAVTELHLQGWVEDVRPSTRLWSVLVHQLFANVLEAGGLTRKQLIDRVSFVPSFASFTEAELAALVDHLTVQGWLEAIDGALVLGRRAEKRFGARNFFKLYSVFEAGETLVVRHGNTLIGTLDRWFVLMLSGNRPLFRLAGRGWKITEMDLARGVLRVVPAPAGEAPQWTGRPEMFGRRVCEQILDLLKSDQVPEGMDETGEIWLAHARGLLAQVPVSQAVRPLVRDEKQSVWHTFAGNGINSVLARLMTHFGAGATSVSNLSVKIKGNEANAREAALRAQEALVGDDLPPVEEWGEFDTAKRTAVLSSFQECLPAEAEQAFLRDSLLDLAGARAWATQIEMGSPMPTPRQ